MEVARAETSIIPLKDKATYLEKCGLPPVQSVPWPLLTQGPLASIVCSCSQTGTATASATVMNLYGSC